MRTQWLLPAIVLSAVLATTGCGSRPSPPVVVPAVQVAPSNARSDAELLRSADVSILFVGNSHTGMHRLPELVAEMIRFRHPEKVVRTHHVWVGFLEDTARDPACRLEIESLPWTFIVLQAQKESRSGRAKYSQAEGIDIAKLGKARGASVVFFAEWGLQETTGHGSRIERIYDEMATAAAARVAPVGRAWELALAARPDMSLYEGDGNHQTAVGAFLSAAVLFGRLTNESPAVLATFPYDRVVDTDRMVMLEAAAKALAEAPCHPEAD